MDVTVPEVIREASVEVWMERFKYEALDVKSSLGKLMTDFIKSRAGIDYLHPEFVRMLELDMHLYFAEIRISTKGICIAHPLPSQDECRQVNEWYRLWKQNREEYLRRDNGTV